MAEPLPETTSGGTQTAYDVLQDAAEPAALAKDDFDRDVWCLMGLPADVSGVDQAMAAIDQAVRANRKLSFVTPNVNWLVRALRDSTARQEILNADLSLVDGAPLVMMAKLLGIPIRSRVAGSDLFEALRRRPGFVGSKLKVFFFGGREGAAEAAAKAVNDENGGVRAVGFLNPGHGDVESMSTQAVIKEINANKPDFVVVALGAAKGQAWIECNRERLTAPVTAHLGAVIDFTAGGVARAPRWMQSAGLEWAWRIKEEPSLWRRYLKDGLSLIHLMATCLAPQLVRLTDSGQPAAADVRHLADETHVMLSGDLRRESLAPVRDAFRACAASGRVVCLDFTKVESFDRAFLGLVLMLEAHLARSGGQIVLVGASPSQRRLFKANNMNYAARDRDSAEKPAGETMQREAAV
jgi:N-acetylglucosaminyldiphosphoundecaprenol N-acetyl-beta-D-mannosaminyltransferase